MPVTGMPMASAAVTATRHSSGFDLGGDVVDGAALMQVRGAAHPQPQPLGQHVVELPSLGDRARGYVVDGDARLAARGGRAAPALRLDEFGHRCVPVPMTSAGIRSAAATTLPSITTSLRSSPGARSGMMLASALASGA